MKRLLIAVFVLFVIPASAEQAPAPQAQGEESYYLITQEQLLSIDAAIQAQRQEIARLRARHEQGGCL